MANKIADRPFVTVNLKLKPADYIALKDLKESETWEEMVLRLAGLQ
ncbi:hypothetical protein M0R72_19500 [Candidatus Pacearchaeota archaeon]|jgi:hypothetical protein|nr:hypothetical protein [Candidatus Pacearchaeota archaeon]